MHRVQREELELPPAAAGHRPRGEPGVWLPWGLAADVLRRRLRPPSRWQVFLAVLMTQMRYGGTEAHLGAKEIALMTGLAVSTVKRAVSGLLADGILHRPSKRLRLVVDLTGTAAEGTRIQAPNAAHLEGPLPISVLSSTTTADLPLVAGGVFTPRQVSTIVGVISSASELLGSDASDLPLTESALRRLDLPEGSTYRNAMAAVESAGDRRMARDLVAAVLGLNEDARVQGVDLEDFVPKVRGDRDQ